MTARLGLLIFFSILLIACVRPVLQPEDVVFSESKLPEKWLLEGRIGIQLPSQSWQAAIHWHQYGEDFEISLRSPFGRVLRRIQKQDEDVVLVDGDGQTYYRSAGELDHLVSEQLGVPVPVSSLRYWILGQPQPGRSWQLLDSAQGVAQGFSQEGWKIRFHGWSLFNERMLPARLTLRRDAIKVRLVLHEWSTAPVE
ncbi:hypothetical protein MNBD_GAMMA26-621 [hydrothermal vent metagenome]|uniref:Outer-membrane lipoprotein LolB n=1 Tax=hydrothermal vent metagenome TaxID=652676 RepID=A0A3B1AJ82_9ZZZZ